MDVCRYSIVHEPVWKTYHDLLSVGTTFCNGASLVIRPRFEKPASENVLNSLRPFLKLHKKTDEWPGTKLLGHVADYFEYTLTPEFLAKICEMTTRLYQWREPDFPEDLCLYRPDGSAWLGSIAHEQDAFLVLNADEFDQVRSTIPALQLSKDD